MIAENGKLVSKGLILQIFLLAFMLGCSSAPTIPDIEVADNLPVKDSNELILTETSGNIDPSDQFLGEYSIVIEGDVPELIQTRSSEMDFDGTDFVSVYSLRLTSLEWIDDPDESDPNQGTYRFGLYLSNNTPLDIYDFWLIFGDLGLKEVTNPSGITSRAYIIPDDKTYASRPYLDFSNESGILEGHSTSEVSFDLFLPKECNKVLWPIGFVIYGSYPEDYIDVGEGHSNPSQWRELFDNTGGRGIVGSAIETVQPFGDGFSQKFTNGCMILNPVNGICYYMPKDFSDVYWALENPLISLGYPNKILLTYPDHPEFVSFYGTHFAIMEFENDASMYKHIDGSIAGLVVPVPNGFNAAWRDQVGAWGGAFGLPVSYEPDAGQSFYGTHFDLMTFEGEGEVYKHISGDHEGDTWAVPEDYLDKWDDNEEGSLEYNGKYEGVLGLPTEYLKSVGSTSYYGTKFGVMHFEGTGTFWKHLSGTCNGKIFLVPDDFSEIWAQHQSWWYLLGLPISHTHAGPSSKGTTFEMMEFEGHQTIYKHTSGSQEGLIIYLPADFNAKWASYGGWWGNMGLPNNLLCKDCGPSSHGTLFSQLGFENGGSIYKHEDGPHSGGIYVIQGSINNKWKTVGAWWGTLGLPIGDSYNWPGGGYAQDFESCTIHPPGATVDCGGATDCSSGDLPCWIAWVALNEWDEGEVPPGSWGCHANGCCKHWADNVVDRAQDLAGCPGSGLPSGTINLGTPVSFSQSKAGDILQIGYYPGEPGYNGSLVHTAIVLAYKGNSRFDVIDCNWCSPYCNEVHKRYNWNVSGYQDPRVYRINCN